MQIDSSSIGGESLDDIIMQNSKEIQLQQSLSQAYHLQDASERSAMMEFGGPIGSLQGFQFGNIMPPPAAPLRRHSSSELGLDTSYMDVSPGIAIPAGTAPFPSPAQQADVPPVDAGSFHMPATMQRMLPYNPIIMQQIPEDPSIGMYNSQFNYHTASIDPLGADYVMNSHNIPGTQGNMTTGGMESALLQPLPGISISGGVLDSPANLDASRNIMESVSPLPSNDPYQDSPNPGSTPNAPAPTIQTTRAVKKAKVERPAQHQNISTTSEFDVSLALIKVNTRENPEVNIAPVDMSCPFVVCDATIRENPIIYVSDKFEHLTGYKRHEILGHNCRFLQSPQGELEAGAKRIYCDHKTIHYLKRRIDMRKEVQRGLINYRKGGQPFINLLTLIPITWDTDEIKYYVGFQVDILGQPDAIMDMAGGTAHIVNYSQPSLPAYVLHPPAVIPIQDDSRHPLTSNELSVILNSLPNSNESELTRNIRDRALLENTDDMICVLSSKGQLLYVSPSCKRIWEYDSSELVGQTLSAICHPSDIVPVTRELVDLKSESAVDIVFRIRCKKSGYVWFESHASPFLEDGKYILMVGRQRPVYGLSRKDVDTAGGIGENEVWTKLSTTGMFLFVSSNIRTLLDRQPEELIGTSMQALMRPDSRIPFGRALQQARAGSIVTHKHEIHNKRGLVLQAQTTLFPGDVKEGQKPSFLVAQTHLLKASSRSTTNNSNTAQASTPNTHLSTSSILGSQHETSSPIATNPGPSSIQKSTSKPVQHPSLASDDGLFEELQATSGTSWQYELRQTEKNNRILAEELAGLITNKKKRKRRKGGGNIHRQCSNCHTMSTPEWRRGPTGQRDLCNSCGLRFAKQVSRDSSNRTSTIPKSAAFSKVRIIVHRFKQR
ncbi:hypothetical protein F5884DRAFT_659169 [Xylogone sp. PMI_703]|nr:hypothetical protein F5884DRAFT_659169 [Xylogone sp. PMI_703]